MKIMQRKYVEYNAAERVFPGSVELTLVIRCDNLDEVDEICQAVGEIGVYVPSIDRSMDNEQTPTPNTPNTPQNPNTEVKPITIQPTPEIQKPPTNPIEDLEIN